MSHFFLAYLHFILVIFYFKMLNYHIIKCLVTIWIILQPHQQSSHLSHDLPLEVVQAEGPEHQVSPSAIVSIGGQHQNQGHQQSGKLLEEPGEPCGHHHGATRGVHVAAIGSVRLHETYKVHYPTQDHRQAQAPHEELLTLHGGRRSVRFQTRFESNAVCPLLTPHQSSANTVPQSSSSPKAEGEPDSDHATACTLLKCENAFFKEISLFDILRDFFH